MTSPATPTSQPTEKRPARSHPVLDQLSGLYPKLFGESPLPLKRGIFQDLLEAHPEVLPTDGLKAALALHTRSTRYLSAVASGQARHNLAGEPVEAVAPEQLHHALIEVFRRRQSRVPRDLRPQLRLRIAQAFEASGLGQEAYATLVHGRDEAVNAITREALEQASARMAREAALLRAFESSGQDIAAFAGMYGMSLADAQHTLDRARARR